MSGKLVSERAEQQLQELVRRGVIRGQSPSWPRAAVNHLDVYHAKSPSGGIPAVSGSTPGSATCDLYWLGSGGTLTKMQDEAGNDMTATIYNDSSEVAGDVWLKVIRMPGEDGWELWVFNEQCS